MVFHKFLDMKKLLLFAALFAFLATAQAQTPSITDNSLLKFVEGNNSWSATALAFKTYMASGGGTVTSFSAGDLAPLFTSTVTNPTTTPNHAFTLTSAAANTWFGNATAGALAPSYNAAGALTKTDDANVTLTLGGTPASSLLKSVSMTLGWTGTLSAARGGTGLGSVGGDVTLLGSNGSANIYYTPAITNLSAAIAYSRAGTTLNLNIPDADASFRGTVSTTTQTFAGNKTFTGTVTATGLVTGNGGIKGVATATDAALNAAGVEDGDYAVTTASLTLDQTHNTIAVGTLTANITLTLPACNATHDGWEYNVIKTGSDTFAVILDPNGAETFYDSAATKSIYSQGNGATCKCRSSSTSWFYQTN